MIIAVDFDGTIVEHQFPNIGREMPGAVQTLQDMSNAGHKIVIWTCRCGAYIGDMVDWLDANGVKPDAINSNVADVPGFAVPKILADVYIDDRNFGGFPGWGVVRDHFLPKESEVCHT